MTELEALFIGFQLIILLFLICFYGSLINTSIERAATLIAEAIEQLNKDRQ